MKTLKLLTACALMYGPFCSYAGNKLPVEAGTGEVVYRHSFKLPANVTNDDAYAIAQNWFNADASKFTCQSGEGANVTCKNKALVEDEFKNAQPLQSLDPAVGRITGKGVMKFYGGPLSAISLLYTEYYVVLEVKDHQLTATVSKLKYHHFNQRSYSEKPIYLWQGGRPFDAADKLENLVNGPTESKDLQDLGTFVNQQVATLFTGLQSYLQTQKMLDPSQLARASAGEN
jgi:hypothetical protein